MRSIRLFILSAMFASGVSAAHAQKNFSVDVVIANFTSQEVSEVVVIHQFDKSVTASSLSGVKPNTVSSGKLSFQTAIGGSASLHSDWFFVAWGDAQGAFYSIDPINFRGLMDFLEREAPGVIKTLVPDVVPGGKTLVDIALKLILNGKPTVGLKKCNFDLPDAVDKNPSPIRIVLKTDSVLFDWPSGKCETGVKLTTEDEVKKFVTESKKSVTDGSKKP